MDPVGRTRNGRRGPSQRGGRLAMSATLLLMLGGLASCGGSNIVLNYPSEQLDFQLENLRTPALYIESVVDRRSLEQRRGSGHFLVIDFPKETDWAVDPAATYAEALAQDVEQTHLVELVPLRAQADYVLTGELVSLGCEFRRSLGSFLIPGLLGAGVGAAFGDDFSSRLKRAAVGGFVGIITIPMPSRNRAEAEIRLTLKDRSGNVLWEETCLGEVEQRVYVTATSRQDQDLVDATLPRAIKKANACLLGQLRRKLLELATQ